MSTDVAVREIPVFGERARDRFARVFVILVSRPETIHNTLSYRVRVSSAATVRVVEVWLRGRWVEVGRYLGGTFEEAAQQGIRDITEGIEDEW